MIYVKRTISEVAREIYNIGKGTTFGVVGIILPLPKGQKPKWCQCSKCGGWHYLAK